MTHLQRWLLAGTVLQVLQIGPGGALAAQPGAGEIVVAQAQLTPEQELLLKKKQQEQQQHQQQAPKPQMAPPPPQVQQPPKPQFVQPPPQVQQPPKPQFVQPPPQVQQPPKPQFVQPPPQVQQPPKPQFTPPPQVQQPPKPPFTPPPPQVQQPPKAPVMEAPKPPVVEPPKPLVPGAQPGIQPVKPPLVEPPKGVAPPPGPQGEPGKPPVVEPPKPLVPGAQPGVQPVKPPVVEPPKGVVPPPGPQGGQPVPVPPGVQPGVQPVKPPIVEPPKGVVPPPGPQGGQPVPVPPGAQPGVQPVKPPLVEPPKGVVPPPGPQGGAPVPPGQPVPGAQPGPGGQQSGGVFTPPPGKAPPVLGAAPLNPMPPAPQQQPNKKKGNGKDMAIGAAAGFVGGFLAGQAIGSINDVQSRRQVVEQNGVQYIQEPGRTIIRQGDQYTIYHDENERFRNLGIQMRQENRGGVYYSSYVAPGGVVIYTVTSPDGRLLKRYKRYPNGQEVILIDNTFGGQYRPYDREVIYMPPPPVRIPRDRYIVDDDQADEGVIYETFRAPPVAPVARRYTLDEVRNSQGLRSYMPSVDVNTVTFDTGSWEVSYDAANRLAVIAQAIKQTLQQNPNEVYLVEGHTDAVGSPEDNLSLSDRRAQSVAAVLTRNYGIPAENLTTQGYGEQYLKVQTDGAERANRRVTVRRITPLLTGQGDQQQPGQQPVPQQ